MMISNPLVLGTDQHHSMLASGICFEGLAHKFAGRMEGRPMNMDGGVLGFADAMVDTCQSYPRRSRMRAYGYHD